MELAIPSKREIVLYAPLSPQQGEMYKDLLNKTLLQKIRTCGLEPR